MILGIDIGNTNIVVGLLDEKNIKMSNRISTDKSKTSFELFSQFENMLEFFKVDINQIEGGIISSVVPELTNQVSEAVVHLINKTPLIVGPGIKTGLNIKIDNPQTLGSDRVADAVAAIEEYKAPIIIVDMGTATTISVIDKSKNHIGGMIIPGIKTSLNALSSHASQLPYISIEAPKKLIGKNTIDCMKSGIVIGNAAMIDGLIDRIEEDLNEKATVIATGGLSKVIIEHSKKNINYDENLLLKGLYYIYQKNKK